MGFLSLFLGKRKLQSFQNLHEYILLLSSYFEINALFFFGLPSNKRCTSWLQNEISAGNAYERKYCPEKKHM